MEDDRRIAVGLLTQRDLDRLGSAFDRAIPVEDDGVFDDLLSQLNHIHIGPLGKGAVIRSSR